MLYVITDFDDSATPSTISSLLSYSNCTAVSPGQEHRRIFKPRIAMAAYAGTFTSYANMPASTWIDAASPAVEHYGLKIGIEQCTSTNNASWKILARFKVDLRAQR